MKIPFRYAFLGAVFGTMALGSLGPDTIQITDNISIPNPVATKSAEAQSSRGCHNSISRRCARKVEPIKWADASDLTSSNTNLVKTAQISGLLTSTDIYYAKTKEGTLGKIQRKIDQFRIQFPINLRVNLGIASPGITRDLPESIRDGAATISDRLGRLASLENQMQNYANIEAMRICYDAQADISRLQYDTRVQYGLNSETQRKLSQTKQSLRDNGLITGGFVDMSDIAVGMTAFNFKDKTAGLIIMGNSGEFEIVKGDRNIMQAISTALDAHIGEKQNIDRYMNQQCAKPKIRADHAIKATWPHLPQIIYRQ